MEHKQTVYFSSILKSRYPNLLHKPHY